VPSRAPFKAQNSRISNSQTGTVSGEQAKALPIEVLLDGDTPAALAAAIRRHGAVPT